MGIRQGVEYTRVHTIRRGIDEGVYDKSVEYSIERQKTETQDELTKRSSRNGRRVEWKRVRNGKKGSLKMM